MLDARKERSLKVFAVWEPILFTDLSPPSTWALRRLHDPRVAQDRDREHLVAKQMAADARPPQPEHECCTSKGILWDLVAVYPKGVLWTDRMPPAIMFDGPVIDVEEALAKSLTELSSK